MENFFNVTILALLQGIAEFLPISSSGHLVIGQHLLGIKDAGLYLNIFLHLGTLVSIFAFYRKFILRMFIGLIRGEKEALSFTGKLLLSTVPAVIVYALFTKQIETLYNSPLATGIFLIITGFLLISTRFVKSGESSVNWHRALVMGIAQAFALLPGVSRSGSTIVAARLQKVTPCAAAEFSFLMSAPLILGGALLETKDIFFSTEALPCEISGTTLIYGMTLSAVVGYFALSLLVRTLNSSSFWMFGPYCILAGILTCIFC